jgi:penicillin-insensitive murein endopeptidase
MLDIKTIIKLNLKIITFVFIFIFFYSFKTESFAKNLWENQTQPKGLENKSIGTHNLGCLSAGVKIDIYNKKFEFADKKTTRNFANIQMKDFINYISDYSFNTIDKKLIIGDIALPIGGEFSSGHESHQTGLDADFWYYLLDTKKQTKENLNQLDMVDHDLNRVSKYWNKDIENILKKSSEYTNVDRIFVNPIIKKELCTKYKNQQWLSKIRPWWNHSKHFHVRLKCPKDNKDCINPNYSSKQESIDGCDETLEWWLKPFSKKDLDDINKKKQKEKSHKKQDYPSKCYELLN